ncbi:MULTISPECIES: hypothetical protein [unclassified Mesorhizobium]|uniref:hypothetical protein n=1 Tax=unclassified Mesorhizobium TaxID=325217 RepID=UPI0015E325EE|nr:MULTISPECIES: hypothetical protein [unclassified Mesorhizobium]
MTENKRAALQKAFEKGQQSAREGRYDNRHPSISPYHDRYDQGFEVEMETIFD